MTDSLKLQGEVSLDSSGAEEALGRVGQAAGSMAQKAVQAGAQAGAAVGAVGAVAGQAATKLDSGTRSMIGSIQRATAAFESGGKSGAKYYEVLANQRGINADVLKPYIDQLRQAEEAHKKATGAAAPFGAALHGVGDSANLSTAQMQGLVHSARGFFDMILAGQSPLKAFALESAKLTGTFGGAGAAVDGVKTAIGGLLSPIALSIGAAVAFAAGIGAVAYAASQGAAEIKKFNEANILTGNALGVTNSQFGQLRDAIGGIATQGKAAEVLTEIAANGTLAGSAVRQVAEAAILMEKATGIATAETVKQFAELAKSPAEAAAKLNDSTNFLTASLYRQIKALEEQGQHVAAANLAENAYAEALKDRAQAVLDNSGIMVKAWRGVTGAAKDAWDAMLGIGRQVTNADQITILQRNLQDRQARNKSLGIGDSNGDSAMTADIKQQISLLQENERIEKRMVTVGAERAAQAKGEVAFSAIEQANLTKRQQLEQEINKIRETGLAAGRSQLDIDKQIANARQKYAETGGLDQLASIKAAAVTAQQTIDLLQKKMDAGDTSGLTKLTEAEVKVNEIQAKLTVTTNGATRAHLQQALAVAQNTITVEKQAAAVTAQYGAWKKALGVVDEQTAANDKLAESYQQQALEQQAVAASFGKSDIAIKQALLSQVNLKLSQGDSSTTTDKYTASLVNMKEGLEALIPALQAVAQKQEALNLSHISDANRNDAAYLATELSLIGQTAEVRDRILTQKRIELEYDQKILDLQKKGLTAEDLAADTAQLQQQKQVALNNAATKQFIDDWQKVTDQIEGLGHQLWDDLFAGGHDAFKRIGQDIKKFLLDELYQLTVKKWIIQIASSTTGGSGLAGSAASGLGQSLGLNNLVSSAGSSLGLTGPGSIVDQGLGLFGGGSGLGGAAVTSTEVAGTAAATSESLLAAGATAEEAAAAGTALAGSVEATGAAAGALGAGVSGALAAIPVVGWIALAAYAAYKIFGQAPGGPKEGAYAGAATVNPTGNSVGGKEMTPEALAAVKQTVSGLTSSYQTYLQSVGGSGAATFGFGIQSDPKGDAPSAVEATVRDANGNPIYSVANNNVGRDDTALKAEITLQSERAVLTALQASSLPQNIQDYLAKLNPLTANAEQIADALTLTQEVGAFDKALSGLGETFAGLSTLSVDASEALIKASGGLDNLKAGLSSFYGNFFTDAEKKQNTATNIAKALTGAGLNYSAEDVTAMTKDQFRAIVEDEMSQVKAGVAGADTALAALLNVSQAFSDIHPTADTTTAADAATTAADDATKAWVTAGEAARKAAQDWFDSYVAANDAITQAQKASAAASAQIMGDVLTSMADKFQATFKGIRDEIDAIRGTFSADVSPQNLQGAQAAFQQALTTVMSGGPGADKASQQLPALAQALLAQEQGQSGSYLDLLTVQAATAQQLQDALPYLNQLHTIQTAQVASALSGQQLAIPSFQGGTPASYGASPVVDAIDSLNRRIDRLHTAVEAVAVHTQATSSNTRRALDRGVPALADPSA